MKIPVWVLLEAKGDIPNVPFCTGLLFCEITSKQPHLVHPSHFKTAIFPLWEKELPFSSASENPVMGSWCISASWAVYRTAATVSSVSSGILVEPSKTQLICFVLHIFTYAGRFDCLQLLYLMKHLRIYFCIRAFIYLPRFIRLILHFFSSLIP